MKRVLCLVFCSALKDEPGKETLHARGNLLRVLAFVGDNGFPDGVDLFIGMKAG
jgi:hypothetical protein